MMGHRVAVFFKNADSSDVSSMKGTLNKMDEVGIYLYVGTTMHFIPMHRIVEIVDEGQNYR